MKGGRPNSRQSINVRNTACLTQTSITAEGVGCMKSAMTGKGLLDAARRGLVGLIDDGIEWLFGPGERVQASGGFMGGLGGQYYA
jgi:hypothetical protein